MTQRSIALAALAMACVTGTTSPLKSQTASQNTAGGVSAELTFSERLVSEDGDVRAQSQFGFSLGSSTRREALTFSLATDWNKRLSGDAQNGIDNPRINLGYQLENRNLALGFNASYSRLEINRTALADPEDDTTLVIDNGDREVSSFGGQFDFGREAPFGGTFSLGLTRLRYVDTVSTDLVDQDTETAGLTLRFRIDPRITARTSFDLSDLNRLGGDDVQRQTFSVGATLAATKTLELDVSLGSRSIRSVREDGRRSTTEGLFATFDANQDRPNGELGFSFSSQLNENGRRSNVRLTRSLELPDGNLSGSLGAVFNHETDTTDPLYSLNYQQALTRSSFQFGLQQRVSTDSRGDEALRSTLNVGVTHQLTAQSSLGANLNFNDVDFQGTTADDNSQTSLGLNYNQTLTRDWTLTSGYTHTRRSQDGQADTRENVLFLGLRTSIGWNP